MTRLQSFLLGWTAGSLVLALAATVAHAEPIIDPAVAEWADWIGIDATDLQGAVYTTGLHVEDYLVAIGAVERAPVLYGGCPPLIVQTFGPYASKACAVAWCESNWIPTARGRLGEKGWFQIMPFWGDYSDPAANVRFAYELSRGGTDWRHWSCR